MSEHIKHIDTSVMLDIIELLPRVNAEETDVARDAFVDAFNSYEGHIPFVQGHEGDGAIFVNCNWSDVYEGQETTTLALNDDGWLINNEVSFEERIPFRVARYFIATAFGLEELTPLAQKHFYVEKKKAAGLENDVDEDYVPEPTPSYVPELLKGARLLYECAELAGDLSYCQESEGMKIIARVKEQSHGN
jgi:hypothetical protein